MAVEVAKAADFLVQHVGLGSLSTDSVKARFAKTATEPSPLTKEILKRFFSEETAELSLSDPIVMAATAGGDGDPPKRPTGGLPKDTGHYSPDAPEQTGHGLKGIKMAKEGWLNPTNFINPAMKSQDQGSETYALAVQQTVAARGLLYSPGPVAREQLGKASQRLHEAVSNLSPDLQLALGGRLFGSEGTLPGGTGADLAASLERLATDAVIPGTATPVDRVVVLALMGDIGALYADTGATTGVENRTPEQAELLRAALIGHFGDMNLQPTEPSTVSRVQASAGSNAVGPTKKRERTRPVNDKPGRSGIHDTGEASDDIIGVPEDGRLQDTHWDVAEIRRDRVSAIDEPLVGHMSGSPAEILQVWDMLVGVPANEQFTGALTGRPMQGMAPEEQDERYARAAMASAFLVGMGFHSALEVLEGTLKYTGQDPRSAGLTGPDVSGLAGQGAATDLISEMFEAQKGD